MKEVNKIEFWKSRIDTAVKDYYTVYVASEGLWNLINKIHNQIIDEHIPKNAKVLDAGCGYGRWSTKFDNYVGVDFSPDFIALAQKKFPKDKFIVASLENLPFQDKEFDWGICVSIKNMIVNNVGRDAWDKMETELKRVCKNVLLLEYGSELLKGGANGADEYIIL